jgi:hypothetical protein
LNIYIFAFLILSFGALILWFAIRNKDQVGEVGAINDLDDGNNSNSEGDGGE